MTTEPSTSFDLSRLYSSARTGDPKAEQELMFHLTVSFRLFAQRRMWRREDIEEVVQEAMMTIATKYREVEIESSFAGWCHRILQNKIMDHVKKMGTRSRLDRENLAAREDYCPDDSDIELRKRIINCFRKLGQGNRRHARIMNLHYQGYTTGEICQRLNMTENNYYVILSRARKALQACLGLEGRKP